jgi:monofunctional biosynthetic peptidoglycan transglycosylase
MANSSYENSRSGRPRRSGCRRRLFPALFVLLAAWLAWEALTWPDVGALAHGHPKTTAFIEKYRGWGVLRSRRQAEWTWVPYERISPGFKRAVIVSEDMRFFAHNGFDDAEIRAALKDAWEEKTMPRGASTITQQVAKNLWLSSSYNPLRKVKEAILTRQLEAHLSKRRILEIYLNVVELGDGIYGAEAAARHYYGRSAAGLTDRQAAELASALPRPRSWHPGVRSRAYQRDVRITLRRMAVARWVAREI